MKNDALDGVVMASTKSLLPPMINSLNERKAQFKNLHEQIRLDKLLDHLDFQERVYVQLFRKERQVAELLLKRAPAVRVKLRSWSHTPATMRRASTAAGTQPQSMTLPETKNSELKTVYQPPVLLSTKQMPYLSQETQPFDDEKQQPHPVLLLSPDDALNTSMVELSSEDDRSTRKPRQLQTTDRSVLTQLTESTEPPANDGLSDSYNQSVLDPVLDDTPSVVESCDVVPAAAFLRPISASSRLLQSPVTKQHYTWRSNFQRCNRTSGNLFLAANKSFAGQETATGHQTRKACKREQAEIPPLKSEKASSIRLTRKVAAAEDKQKIAHRTSTVELPTGGRMEKRRLLEDGENSRHDVRRRHGMDE